MWQKGEKVVYVGHPQMPPGVLEQSWGLRKGQTCEVLENMGEGLCLVCGPAQGVRIVGINYLIQVNGHILMNAGHCMHQFRKPIDFTQLLQKTATIGPEEPKQPAKVKEPELT